ncbi:sterol desaturase/sphingolipid hydroxylase (fatty acid hydroxylase superfamily) [Inhella inkyongensis]|uniref:Sterol desaturase/sphingolipid hydroxylase (Fatty acid hydroxylase superfamily) n=1 Tax=Inhella inkyongensis TaxID=392593 RepID=A0A840S098_9BURK|nr:sterol desaturase family protein [Inhella inkyongensis]MBB5203675.1 sterol desaturase/sphingolipid hydroxylase (fatty acid hydroxylase superfamily) [Inhella inkyongensis]
MDTLIEWFQGAQAALFEACVMPLLQGLGLAAWAADAFNGTAWLLAGLLQLAFIALGLGALERWRPVEHWPDARATRVDLIYTLIQRLGLMRLALFFTLDPAVDALAAQGRLWGWQPWHLDGLWPGVSDQPWLAFALYLLVFDFAGYWLHRAQHAWEPWWALHALHHSQRQMGRWADNRNHFLDDGLGAAAFALLGLLLGTEPAQFMAITLITQTFESLQHANVRLHFGPLERLWVSPRFHRQHHAIGLGHESAGPGSLGGHNFGVLLPWWDQLFGTAHFGPTTPPTGIRDQLPEGGARDYGAGLWNQQALGLRRLWQALHR